MRYISIPTDLNWILRIKLYLYIIIIICLIVIQLIINFQLHGTTNIALVVSPLRALMQTQCSSLLSLGIAANVIRPMNEMKEEDSKS